LGLAKTLKQYILQGARCTKQCEFYPRFFNEFIEGAQLGPDDVKTLLATI